MSAEVAAHTLPSPPATLPADVCANCGAPLRGPFCAQCGQHVRDIHQSVWRFVADFFDNAFCWDNKLFLTLQPLLTRPGALTLDYLGGRRVRYVHPLRLFLFTSCICLGFIQYFGGSPLAIHSDVRPSTKKNHRTGLNLHLGGDSPTPAPRTAAAAVTVPLAAPPAASPATLAARSPTNAAKPDSDDDENEATDPAEGLSDDIKRAVATGLQQAPAAAKDAGPPGEDLGARIARRTKARIKADGGTGKLQQELSERSERLVSWVALALLPIFAGMLRSVYWRRESFYFAHFVFSLHYHTFLLLFFAAYPVLKLVLPTSFWPVRFLLPLSILILPGGYLYLALRRMYGESVRRTTAKVMILGAMHVSVLVLGLLIVGGFTFLHTVG